MSNAPAKTVKVYRLRDALEYIKNLLCGIICIGVDFERIFAVRGQHRNFIEFVFPVLCCLESGREAHTVVDPKRREPLPIRGILALRHQIAAEGMRLR